MANKISEQELKTQRQQAVDQKTKDKIKQRETKKEIREIKGLKKQRRSEDKEVLKSQLKDVSNKYKQEKQQVEDDNSVKNKSIEKDFDGDIKTITTEFKSNELKETNKYTKVINNLNAKHKQVKDKTEEIENNHNLKLKELEKVFNTKIKKLTNDFKEKETDKYTKVTNNLNAKHKQVKDKAEEIENSHNLKLKELEKDFNEKIKVLTNNFKEKESVINKNHNKSLSLLNRTFITLTKEISKKESLEISSTKQAWRKKYKKGDWDNSEGKIVEVSKLKKYYITPGIVTPVLNDLTVEIKKGEIVAILGPSGSGKTTLLNLISGLDTAHGGDIVVANKNLIYLSDSELTKFRAKNVSFIFQSYNLLPTLNVLENVKTGSQLQKDKNKKLEEGMLLKRLGLFEERYKYPYQLSGGQQQRVSIARALAKNPSILFGDEPTGALDTETSVQVLETLVKVNKDFGTTLVLVTHNPNVAKICSKIIKVKNGNVDKIIINDNPLDPSKIKWD